MIVGFDLDDTLYPEITYVHSGFRAVAREAEAVYGIDVEVAFAVMIESLELHGRGRAFQDVLSQVGVRRRADVDRLVRVYRHHRPDIMLPAESQAVLDELTSAGHRLYLVTDGHKVVQAAKVDALGLRRWFLHCYLTSRYGQVNAKPARRVFDLMVRREDANGADLAYVGDDPAKDFVAVRQVGGRSVRVLTGQHASVQAVPEHDADVTVERLANVPPVIERWSMEPPSAAASGR